MLINKINDKLKKLSTKGLTRHRVIVSNKYSYSNKIYCNGNKFIDFSSNDYLNLAEHPKLIECLTKSIRKYGFGSGSSSLISGFYETQYELEIEMAKWLNVDRTILFSSGYLANLSVIEALVNKNDVVFSDRLCHSSILDGIHLSKSKNIRYRHCSIKHLNKLFKVYNPRFIITESIFSMEGSIAPLNQIKKLCQIYNTNAIIDDAHGIGILGNNGSGACNHFNITQDIFTCIVIPLGKSFSGIGAIVAGRKEIIEYLLQFSKSYKYTTALPPAICAGLKTSLSVIKEETWRNASLKKNINFFISYSRTKKLQLVSYDATPIKSILIGCSIKVIALQNFLRSKGFFVAAIRIPTVPKNSSRIRISINSFHTEKQIMSLINLISENI